jgi:hypothetical protein
VIENVNTDELGNLGLSKKEEVAIATFLETLSDGWSPGHKMDSPVIASLDPVTLTPNPFNPQTRITYTVPRDGLADLSVYDVGGRRVKVLASGWALKGVHTADFSANGMASGVYFVRFATAGTVTTARAILLK